MVTKRGLLWKNILRYLAYKRKHTTVSEAHVVFSFDSTLSSKELTQICLLPKVLYLVALNQKHARIKGPK